MGIDRTKVKTVGMIGAKEDVGTIAFITTGTTVAVPTTLSHVVAAFGQTETGKAIASAPAGRVSGGSVTFTRTDTTSGDTLHYRLVGH